MSDATEVLTVQEGQAAVKQVAVSGEIISLPSATDVKAIVQTDDGPVAAVKTVSLGGGSASGNFVEQLSTMPEASTKQGKIVQYVGTSAPYNQGAFYESALSGTGEPEVSDFTYSRDSVMENVATCFAWIEGVWGKSLQNGDQVRIVIPEPTSTAVDITVSITRNGTTETAQTQITADQNPATVMGISITGLPEEISFTVVSTGAGTYEWREITVDKMLEEMVENYGSVLTIGTTSSTRLTKTLGAQTIIQDQYLIAINNLDSRPSNKALGSVVIDANGTIGVIDAETMQIGKKAWQIVTLAFHPSVTGIPSGGGSYKVLGSTTSSTAAWVEALVVRDIAATATNAGSTYFGGKPFMSKTGANSTTKFQTYTVIEKNIPSTYTLTSDSSEGKVTITDATALYAKINELISQGAGYGSITELRPGLNIMLVLYAEDYYGTGAFQFSLSTLEISDMETMESWSGNMTYIGGESSLSEWGLASTLAGNTMGNIQITTGTIGGTFYLYESQGCAKVQAATETDPTYVFGMPGNMIQMGGIVDLPSMGPGVAVENTPVTLPKELDNANYVVQLTVITDSGFQQVVVDASNRTTTGFDICARNNDSAETVTGAKAAWTVVGAIPMTLYSGQA